MITKYSFKEIRLIYTHTDVIFTKTIKWLSLLKNAMMFNFLKKNNSSF